MSNGNPIDLLFEGMEKLGPGSNSDTLKVLYMLPEAVHGVIVDAGRSRKAYLDTGKAAPNISACRRFLRAVPC